MVLFVVTGFASVNPNGFAIGTGLEQKLNSIVYCIYIE